MTKPRPRLGHPRFETIALSLAIASLAAASGITWKTLPASASPISSHPSLPSWSGPWLVERLAPRPVEANRGHEAVGKPRAPLAARALRPSRAFATPRPLPLPTEPGPPEPARVRVALDDGRVVVARVHGGSGSRVVVLPDGSLGWPNGLVTTDEPFRPLSADELAESLKDGPYRHFSLVRTEHYLVFHTSSPDFARRSGQLLENLYRGMTRKFRDMGLPVHESEFPLVAVVFRNETEFREHRDVPREVQAYYEALSNQIFLFETRDRDVEAPEIAAMRKPQTVAHEGTHQILMNIGIQPRLARWPAWLSEGLAEYCAPTTLKERQWAGFGLPVSYYISTMQELEDTLALQGRGRRLIRNAVGKAPGRCTVGDLSKRDDLAPTDYALAWGLVHFLASKRRDDFVDYLRMMGRMRPLSKDAREDSDAIFRKAFGEDLPGIGQDVHRHLAALPKPEPMPYYAVMFEQFLEDGVVRRGTMVSQSPLIIQQWLESMAEGFDAPWVWKPFACPNRAAAFAAADRWIRSR